MDVASLREPFERWLDAHMTHAERVEVVELTSPKSGFSALTLVAPVRITQGGETRDDKVVLRVESPDPAVYPAQAPGLDVEVEIQYRVMEALAKTGVAPLAPLVGYEPDPQVLGQPFFAMGFVDGDVTIENPPYTQQGFFAEARPEARRSMIESGLRVLARIHQLDWRQAGFDWLVPPGTQPGLEAQLALWDDFGRRELRDRHHPVFEAGVAYLREMKGDLGSDTAAGSGDEDDGHGLLLEGSGGWTGVQWRFGFGALVGADAGVGASPSHCDRTGTAIRSNEESRTPDAARWRAPRRTRSR